MAVHRDDSERFRRLSILGRIGWWEADFSSRQYLCSEYVCKLLGLEGEYLSFEDFGKMIREDYRTRISREFLAIQNMEVYEQTFPIYSTEGVVWVYSRVGYKEHLPDGSMLPGRDHRPVLRCCPDKLRHRSGKHRQGVGCRC